jgi:hypothetical protein
MFRTDLLSIIRSLSTVYKAIGICHDSYVDCLLADSQHNSAHHQEFIHCTLSNGTCRTGLKRAFEQEQDGTGNGVPSWSCSKALYKPVWYIPLLSVQWINFWWWAEDPAETCRVSCRSMFGKLVHLDGFIIMKFVTMHGHVNVKKYFI